MLPTDIESPLFTTPQRLEAFVKLNEPAVKAIAVAVITERPAIPTRRRVLCFEMGIICLRFRKGTELFR